MTNIISLLLHDEQTILNDRRFMYLAAIHQDIK